MWTILRLECNHNVRVEAEVKKQYFDDAVYVLCPICKQERRKGKKIPLLWSRATGRKVVDDAYMHNVSSQYALVMRSRIMRLQPSVPSHRRTLFPWRDSA